MSLDEIDIQVTPDGILVDLFPDQYVEIEEELQPTEKHPEILVDIGKYGGKLVPARVHYPKDWSIERVLESVPALYKKKGYCAVCERKRRKLLKRLQGIAELGGSSKDNRGHLEHELARLKAEVADLKSDGQPGPLPPLPLNHPFGPGFNWLNEKHDRMMESVAAAGHSFFNLVMELPRMPRIPSLGEAMQRASGK